LQEKNNTMQQGKFIAAVLLLAALCISAALACSDKASCARHQHKNKRWQVEDLDAYARNKKRLEMMAKFGREFAPKLKQMADMFVEAKEHRCTVDDNEYDDDDDDDDDNEELEQFYNINQQGWF